MSSSVLAQNLEGQSVVSVRAGVGITGILIKTAAKVANISTSNSGLEQEVSTNNKAAISLTYDYAINDNISLGLLGSMQVYNGSIKNYGFTTANDTFILENIDFKLKRFFIGITPKYHWNIDNEKLDLYSGIRVGYIIWSNDINTSDPNFNLLDNFKLGVPAGAIVPIAANAYFTDNIGANFEVALGSPYMLSVGLQVKF
jgi:outer membrane protein W